MRKGQSSNMDNCKKYIKKIGWKVLIPAIIIYCFLVLLVLTAFSFAFAIVICYLFGLTFGLGKVICVGMIICGCLILKKW